MFRCGRLLTLVTVDSILRVSFIVLKYAQMLQGPNVDLVRINVKRKRYIFNYIFVSIIIRNRPSLIWLRSLNIKECRNVYIILYDDLAFY